MTKFLLSSLLLLAVSSSQASILAVVDSGVDFLHPDLTSKVWINPLEIAGNDRDEDKNGYPDDINGWNFAEGNNTLIDYKYSYTDNADSRRFFEVQLKSFLGTITQEDRDWAREKFKDETFVKNLQIFGNWVHGTHVTGISVKNSPDVKAIGIKLIPTEVKLPGEKSIIGLIEKGGVKETVLKAALGTLAQQQTKTYLEIGSYINGAKADVMNGSFGTSYEAISGVIAKLYKTVFRKDPTADEIKIYTDHFFSVALEETKKFLSSSPKTLFIFAAGNEGTDNDAIPSSPTNVVAENKISVAATLGDKALANFSCYGAKNVEVAAPGVGIESTSPMGKYLAVSGTSQAAPYVANIAARIKDINPALGFREIKKIILETVDVKPWLVGKVLTGGLVNRERAIRAAELSRSGTLAQAIVNAKNDVLAKTENEKMMGRKYYQVPKELVLPLPSPVRFIE